jgi:hypothetical protein
VRSTFGRHGRLFVDLAGHASRMRAVALQRCDLCNGRASCRR